MADNQNDARVGSGEFIRDRGYPDPEDFRRRARIACEIAMLIEDRGLSVADIAGATGLTIADAERLEQSVVRGLSLEGLTELHDKLRRYCR